MCFGYIALLFLILFVAKLFLPNLKSLNAIFNAMLRRIKCLKLKKSISNLHVLTVFRRSV